MGSRGLETRVETAYMRAAREWFIPLKESCRCENLPVSPRDFRRNKTALHGFIAILLQCGWLHLHTQ
eukprot:5776412-Prymnesium_polylepis.1